MGRETGPPGNREINRLLTDLCILCGEGPLIRDINGHFPEYHACSPCTEYIKRARVEVMKPHKKGKGSQTIRVDVANFDIADTRHAS